MAIQSGKMDEDSTLDDVDMEEDIKTLVSDEIKKFRKSYQNYEEEKAKHRAKRDKDKVERPDTTRTPLGKESTRDRSHSPVREDTSKLTEEDRDKKRVERLAKEEEEYEQRQLDRKKRERDDAYKERLRAWQTRERRKAKQCKYDREKEMEKKEEMETEAWNLSKFLEDYDDTKQDTKYYRGNGFSRRRREREMELEKDKRDRQREKEELESLRLEVMERQIRDREREASRRRNKGSDDEDEDDVMLPVRTDIDVNIPLAKTDYDTRAPFPPIKVQAAPSVSAPEESSPEEKSPPQPPKLTFGIGKKPSTPSVSTPTNSSNNGTSIEQMFGNEEDAVVEPKPKKKFSLMSTEQGGQLMATLAGVLPGTELSHEERKRLIQSLVSSLPTRKEELFGWDLKWNNIDQHMVDKKIAPWINKKIVEYIGDTEPKLTNFICKKLLEHTQPEDIFKDLLMVLDKEAEVFVMKLWRLLIYETEARHLGISKSYS